MHKMVLLVLYNTSIAGKFFLERLQNLLQIVVGRNTLHRCQHLFAVALLEPNVDQLECHCCHLRIQLCKGIVFTRKK